MSESLNIPSLGVSHFLSQTDSVGAFVLTVLAVMSLLSWYLIALKLWQNTLTGIRSKAFLNAFCRLRHPGEALSLLTPENVRNPFARLLEAGLEACELLKEAQKDALKKPEHAHGFTLAAPDDFVSAALHHGIAEESRRLENGLTALASIASSAPFVGLFGTVWGIYHALLAIGFAGSASLDKVAGPVGEALVMTACGLAVAIPAVLAYNAFTRANRNQVGELESHAHDLFCLLGLGRITSAQVTYLDERPPHSSMPVSTPRTEGAR
ncbi:MAG: MotA/TolQ/ExbB proton channel family protein [Zoogloeaceae bacterium]|jgi:biopolymer transport protein ExbB|nr:MotA/TolQ/ExbB proton channel family protein [Zoogloeaceae bacterium]